MFWLSWLFWLSGLTVPTCAQVASKSFSAFAWRSSAIQIAVW